MRQRFPNPDQHTPEAKLARIPRLTVKKLSRKLSVRTEVYKHRNIWAISLHGERVAARFSVSRIPTITRVLVSGSISRAQCLLFGVNYAGRGIALQLRFSQLTLNARFGLLQSTVHDPGGDNDSPSQRERQQPDFD